MDKEKAKAFNFLFSFVNEFQLISNISVLFDNVKEPCIF